MQKNKILLFEDCAHAHGASFNGKKAGTGAIREFILLCNKTISTGEGGVLVSKNKNLIKFAKQFRNYGKPNLKNVGKNFRMNEFNAALGCVQIDRLNDIVEWKNNYVDKIKSNYSNTLNLPDKMISGFYKFIVFQKIQNGTGKVYEKGCHKIFGENVNLPNTDWVNKNHWSYQYIIKINMKILVTGGSGLAGSFVVDQLSKDKKSNSDFIVAPNFKIEDNVRYIDGDICYKTVLIKLLLIVKKFMIVRVS